MSVDVLIAGAGPVGMAVAAELGLAGVRCTIVEKRDRGAVGLTKTTGLSVRSMEYNRRWGIADAVRKTGWPVDLPNDFVYCTSMVGYELGRVKAPPYKDSKPSYTPEPAKVCSSIYYEPLLLERIASLPTVTIRHATRLDTFEQDADMVRAALTNLATGQSETISARFLVGCDGAGSVVAKSLLTTERPKMCESVNVHFRSAALTRCHDKGAARNYRFTDARGSWGELLGIDGRELYRLSVLRKDEDCDGPGYIKRFVGADVDYTLLDVMDWRRREFVAERYFDRRVFLAGDSAHEFSPTGGIGQHTGLADAVGLAWMLAAVCHGWGGAHLLRAYEIERRPVAIVNARLSTREFDVFAALPGDAAIGDDSVEGRQARQRWRNAFDAERRYGGFLFNDNVRIGYCYDTSPIIVPDGTMAPPDNAPEFVPSARPGTRAPHAWIGEGRSTLDLFGRGFVLLRLGRQPPVVDGLVAAAAERHVPLTVIDLADSRILELYERRLVLVRPDGHVAWRSDAVPEDSVWLIDRVRGAEHPRP